MKEMADFTTGLIVGAIIAAIVSGTLCYQAGRTDGSERMQREAVRNHVAIWQSYPDGNAKFVWKTPEGETP